MAICHKVTRWYWRSASGVHLDYLHSHYSFILVFLILWTPLSDFCHHHVGEIPSLALADLLQSGLLLLHSGPYIKCIGQE